MHPAARRRLTAAFAVAALWAIVGTGPALAVETTDAPAPEPEVPAADDVIEQRTTPEAQIQAGAARLGIASDSIGWDFGHDIYDVVSAAFPVVFSHAIIGGTISDHYDDVVRAVRSRGGPDVLLLILGTAQVDRFPSASEFEWQMRALINAVLPHVDCVRWLDTQIADGSGIYTNFNRYHGRINGIIHDVVDDYDDRVEYVHYGAWTEEVPRRYMKSDNLHLSRSGKVGLGRLLVQAARGCDERTDVGGYWDVKTTSWAAEAIDWAVDRDLVAGFDNRTYRADIGGLTIDVSRGQSARMLWRLMGEPPAGSRHPWRDGPAWLRGSLDWLHEADLADGYANRTFRPDESISRGAVLRMLWRLAGSPVSAEAHPWADGAEWIDPALDWAAEHDLLNGFAAGTVHPRASITRAQVVSLFRKAEPLLGVPVAVPSGGTAQPPTTSGSTTVPPASLPPTTSPGSTTTSVPVATSLAG